MQYLVSGESKPMADRRLCLACWNVIKNAESIILVKKLTMNLWCLLQNLQPIVPCAGTIHLAPPTPSHMTRTSRQ